MSFFSNAAEAEVERVEKGCVMLAGGILLGPWGVERLDGEGAGGDPRSCGGRVEDALLEYSPVGPSARRKRKKARKLPRSVRLAASCAVSLMRALSPAGAGDPGALRGLEESVGGPVDVVCATVLGIQERVEPFVPGVSAEPEPSSFVFSNHGAAAAFVQMELGLHGGCVQSAGEPDCGAFAFLRALRRLAAGRCRAVLCMGWDSPFREPGGCRADSSSGRELFAAAGEYFGMRGLDPSIASESACCMLLVGAEGVRAPFCGSGWRISGWCDHGRMHPFEAGGRAAVGHGERGAPRPPVVHVVPADSLSPEECERWNAGSPLAGFLRVPTMRGLLSVCFFDYLFRALRELRDSAPAWNRAYVHWRACGAASSADAPAEAWGPSFVFER